MSLSLSIQKSFANFELDVSFEAQTETLGLLGASGCGKSLTLRCIAGLEKPDKGYIRVAGKTFFDSDKGINLSPQERKTALLFQSYMLFPNLTVAQNIAAGLHKNMSKPEKRSAVEEQLERFRLKGFGKRYPIRLSGGQQQRVALARMLAAKPDILMLDEPFTALDSHLKAGLELDLMDLFDEFGGSVLYVSHDIDEAFRFCDRIAVIDNGKLQELSSTDQILNHPSSYATLRVSGVKNISAAKKIDEHTVEAVSWGVALKTAAEVPDDVAYLAVRATFIEPSDSLGDNCFDFKVLRMVDSRFERNVILEPSKNAATTLQWRFKATHRNASTALHKNGVARINIPPERIYLVRR